MLKKVKAHPCDKSLLSSSKGKKKGVGEGFVKASPDSFTSFSFFFFLGVKFESNEVGSSGS